MRIRDAIAAAALALFLSSCERQKDQSGQPDLTDLSNQTDLPDPNATEVFKKAFWRAPSAGDEILHADRREWSDAEGVTKWQWFIAVKPSPELLKYLRDDNAFGLTPAESAQLPEDKPAWFVFDTSEVSVLSSPRGRMQLIFQQRENTLYATDAGGGLQRGAPEPASPTPSAPARATPVPGRLPNSPPPTPES